MIGSLRGILLQKRPDGVIVETGGVGYDVTVPLGVLSCLPSEGENIFLLIHTYVKEDALKLFGFLTDEQKHLFTKVMGVSGIGPKIALGILSAMSVEDFRRVIEDEDVDMLSRIPGLGKKTASRLILELKGKLPLPARAGGKEISDAESALVNLGYRRGDVVRTLSALHDKGISDLETLLKESLKKLTPV
jgi:Holliday junction DNA helicase RuvA